MKSSGIGGQAVMEGIMMRNGSEYSVAVRKENGEIEVKKETYKGVGSKCKLFRLPFIRGIFSFVDSLVLGMKSLNYSASLFMEDGEEEEPGRFDNPVVNLLSKPGLMLQGLTTKEPDEKMAEVAICAVEAVFDWKAYEEANFN